MVQENLHEIVSWMMKMRGGLGTSNGTLNSDENVFVPFSIDYGSCKLEEKV